MRRNFQNIKSRLVLSRADKLKITYPTNPNSNYGQISNNCFAHQRIGKMAIEGRENKQLHEKEND